SLVGSAAVPASRVRISHCRDIVRRHVALLPLLLPEAARRYQLGIVFLSPAPLSFRALECHAMLGWLKDKIIGPGLACGVSTVRMHGIDMPRLFTHVAFWNLDFLDAFKIAM